MARRSCPARSARRAFKRRAWRLLVLLAATLRAWHGAEDALWCALT